MQGTPTSLVGKALRVGAEVPDFRLYTFEEGIDGRFPKQDVLDFGKQFGILLAEHAVLTRAVFVVDENGIVQHEQVVSEFTDEPNFAVALDVLGDLL